MSGGLPAVIEGATIVEAFRNTVRSVPDRPALGRRVADRWEVLTWAEYGRAVQEVSAGLLELGIGAGQQVGIFSNNRMEWHLADFGALANGSVTVPLYQTSAPEQVAYVLGHAEARACFVEDRELAARILEVRDRLPKLDLVVVFDDGDLPDGPGVMGFDRLRAIGAARLEAEPDEWDARAETVAPEHLATLVYTSGTTGPPKGVMISHANVMWTLRSSVSVVHVREGERFLSFLPLSHIAERMISEFLPATIAGETWFARSLASVAEDLRDCRPTAFFGVPRVWEKFQEAAIVKLGEEHGIKKVLVDRYVELGEHVVADHGRAHDAPVWEKVPYAALDAVVGAKVRKEFGLDRAHVLVTAAAPIHPDLIRWFHAVGLPVLELYGQTESCGPTTCSPPEDNRIGAVGPPIPGVELRLDADGEILVRGGNVCMGYFRDPAGTAALLDADGWMHSGDVGTLDADGYLRITGRKKDLIITAGGQNITPQEIETDLRYHDLVAEAVVVGEGRRYLTALIALDGAALGAWADAHRKIADYEALAGDPDLDAEIARSVDDVNSRRSRVENVRKFRILSHELTIAGGELTPTLKVKRNVVNEKYADLIEGMYAEDYSL